MRTNRFKAQSWSKNNCPACGQPFKLWTSQMSVCSSCGLGKTLSKPVVAVDYRQYHRDQTYIIDTSQFENIFARRVALLNAWTKPGRVLEIGSSTGGLLSQLKKQEWLVQGLEPSLSAVRYANLHGIPTIRGTFEKIDFLDNSFTAVVLNHVLEHLVDSNLVLSKAHYLLKRRGVILVDVPNFGSMSARLLGSKWPYLLLNEHRWHFTPKSLFQLFVNNQFKILDWFTSSGIWDYGYPGRELFNSLTGLKKRFFSNFVTALPSWVISQLKLGTSLTYVAQKI